MLFKDDFLSEEVTGGLGGIVIIKFPMRSKAVERNAAVLMLQANPMLEFSI
jgi:hypothetical protein